MFNDSFTKNLILLQSLSRMFELRKLILWLFSNRFVHNILILSRSSDSKQCRREFTFLSMGSISHL